MRISNETLMAYVDGELPLESRTAVEHAMSEDPEVAHWVAQQRALRSALRAAYDGVLEETVPARLIAAAGTTSASESKGAVLALARKSSPRSARRAWAWQQWSAIAASLVLGALAGRLFLQPFNAAPISVREGQLVASGALATALSSQLASTQAPQASVHIGLSYVAKSHAYCRTFALQDQSALVGLACHEQRLWQVQVLAKSESAVAQGSHYRPAGSSLAPAILQAVDAQIVGEPLDARAEAAARDRGWSRRQPASP